MAIPKRQLTAICNIDSGTMTSQNRPPIFTGENGAIEVVIIFKKNGENYTIPSGVIASLYLYYPNTELMTVATEMTISGYTATGSFDDTQLGKEGYPMLTVQLTDPEMETLIVAASFPVKITKSRGKNVIDIRPSSPSEIVYIGRSPYVNTQNNHWMEWDVETKRYVDTGILADGYPPFINPTDKCWMVWDAENEEYVNTHIKAEGENNIDDTAGAGDTDSAWSANKLVTELAGKVPTSRTVNGHALTDNITITKSDLSLGNVDNTSDADKPVSTATQTALNAKTPTSRKINNKALSEDITLFGSDISVSETDNTKIDSAFNTLNQLINNAPTESTAQEILDNEELRTAYEQALWDDLDNLFSNLPSDINANGIYLELHRGNEYLEMLYRECAERENA